MADAILTTCGVILRHNIIHSYLMWLQYVSWVLPRNEYHICDHLGTCWGCSSVVERSLRMWEAPGSIPGISISSFFFFFSFPYPFIHSSWYCLWSSWLLSSLEGANTCRGDKGRPVLSVPSHPHHRAVGTDSYECWLQQEALPSQDRVWCLSGCPEIHWSRVSVKI